ncbi:MAG: hypothetical protein R3Y56_01460 [Akkermansia sp.]
MSKLLIALRALLGLCCASLLLLALSYPDSLMAPDPSKEFFTQGGIYQYREFLWIIPFLALELVCVMGPRRNLVWFTSILTPLVVGLLAWPLIEAYRPELLFPTFTYEDGKLSMGLAYMGAILLASIFFRLLLLHYFFAESKDPYDDNDIGVVELNIDEAKTVREIVSENMEVKPKFLFGEADHGLVARFYARARTLLQMKRLRQALLLVLLALGAAWFFISPAFLMSPEKAEARDWQKMYECTRGADGKLRATHAAVHAGYRILDALSQKEALAGMTVAQAEQFLQLAGVDEEYKQILRDESDLVMNSAEDIFASRTRFLTISDGTRRVVLYVRMNADGDRINICEIQDDGWNAVTDYHRRRLGADWRSNVISR